MATTPSEPLPPAPDAVDQERRLHPFSWLFVLIARLRPFVIPLLVLLFFGRGEQWELYGIIGAVALSLYSLIYSFSFRYRIGKDQLLVREGIFSRTERHIPFARIQNIVQHRNLLHRLFAVTELRLESAGGSKPEAVMSVIRSAEAKQLERLLRGKVAEVDADEADSDSGHTLHQADLSEILRYGLSSNRGAVVVGAAFAAGWQFQFWESSQFGDAIRWLFGSTGTLLDAFGGWLHTLLTGVAVVVLLALVLKALSVLMCLLSDYGFRLDLDEQRVATEAGLVNRRHASANLGKLQRLLLSQSWLARRMGRVHLQCEVASGAEDDGFSDNHRMSTLVPLGTHAEVTAVIKALAPELDPDGLQWRPIHPRAWRRRLWPSLIVASIVAVPVSWLFGFWGPALWTLVAALLVLEARGWARYAAYACTDRIFAFRAGWLTRHWTVAAIGKGQAVLLQQSPFDRRQQMAGVRLDTAGVSATSFTLQIPYLDVDQARKLFDASCRAVAAHEG